MSSTVAFTAKNQQGTRYHVKAICNQNENRYKPWIIQVKWMNHEVTFKGFESVGDAVSFAF